MHQDSSDSREHPLILAITACPTGIAHTYMAAENLQAAADKLGYELKTETHGSIGVEGTFTDDDIARAAGVVVAADTVIDKHRFAGKRLVATGVDAAIDTPDTLLEQALSSPEWHEDAHSAHADDDSPALGAPSASGVGSNLYKALMNGVSHMIPFVVTGGLLLAVSLSIGGQPTPEGLAIPEDSFWFTISQLGQLAFSLMVPVLSGYIAMGIADRPGLAPGVMTGLIATTGSLYGSEAGAGFIGGIVTGILSGYVALAIKKIPVHKYIQPIWPIIVIPIVTTLVVGLAFVLLIGAPLSSLFGLLTHWLSGMEGASTIALGAVIGAMIAFDMGGPFNKTAFLFGGGMIAAGNAGPMGMAATAIAVPPLAVGVATLVRRGWFTKAENDSGIAALFMGFFGITEGAIPLAAARPFQVIPANVIGGAVSGALAGLFMVEDNVMHGGPIVAVLGAVDHVGGYFLALAAGVAVTALLIVVLVGASRRKDLATTAAAAGTKKAAADADADAAADSSAHAGADSQLLPEDAILLDAEFESRDAAIEALSAAAVRVGRVSNARELASAALDREAQHSTGVGHGVAIPHARSAAVTAPVLCFARVAEPGIEWASGEDPTRLVFLIAVPEDAGKKHLKLLSTLARSLMKDTFRSELYAARTRAEVSDVVRGVLTTKKKAAAQAS